MRQYNTVHIMSGQYVRVFVLKDRVGNRTIIRAHFPNAAADAQPSMSSTLPRSAELVFAGPDIARELGTMLKNAAALAAFIEGGGEVQHWIGKSGYNGAGHPATQQHTETSQPGPHATESAGVPTP